MQSPNRTLLSLPGFLGCLVLALLFSCTTGTLFFRNVYLSGYYCSSMTYLPVLSNFRIFHTSATVVHTILELNACLNVRTDECVLLPNMILQLSASAIITNGTSPNPAVIRGSGNSSLDLTYGSTSSEEHTSSYKNDVPSSILTLLLIDLLLFYDFSTSDNQ